MNHISKLIDDYCVGPGLLCDAVQSITEAELDARPVDGKWSVREVVCHLADSEIVYADRIKRVLAEDNPDFFEADPNLFASSLSCPQRPLARELDLINSIRLHMLPILQSCDASDFQRAGTHSLDGRLTLQELLQRITEHIPHHIAFIHEKRKAMED